MFLNLAYISILRLQVIVLHTISYGTTTSLFCEIQRMKSCPVKPEDATPASGGDTIQEVNSMATVKERTVLRLRQHHPPSSSSSSREKQKQKTRA
ncbi:hypothetical protein QQF64_031360 [Cirrhinus molitorella]|uniref:Secreted protein n=1 Tax=Cirrhinus molitorella TaxID=172907 RepID=A0ABR3MWV2_9TELE